MNSFNQFLELMGAGFVLVFMVGYIGIFVLEAFGFWDHKSKKS